MAKLKDTIDDLAYDLHKANFIDMKTLRELTDDDLPVIVEYTGAEIQQIRKSQYLSKSVFVKYLNISPAMIRSLEHGQRHAHEGFSRISSPNWQWRFMSL